MVNFNVKENIILSELNRKDLKDFLRVLDSFYLEYRDNLGLPKDVTFGIEIEYLGVNPRLVDFYVSEIMRDWSSVVDWTSTRDASLCFGGEINSAILNDKVKCWQEIENICNFLKNNGANSTVKKAGGHIHVGASLLGSDYNIWRKFIKLYTVFEDVLYKFCYGDKINGRESIAYFAKPMRDVLISKMWRFNYMKNGSDVKDIFPNDTRGYGLNLRHVNFSNMDIIYGNTLEFRFPNGTVEEVIWQNNINVLVKFLLAVFNSNINENFLDSLIKDLEYQSYTQDSKEDYQAINFRKALLFADLIFDNTFDKIYFLKQYFKNFQYTNEKDLVLAKRFIR